jgi:hypothetical protein
MIDEEFLASLPADPYEAFPIFEDHVRIETLDKSDQDSGDFWERRYITQVLAFADYFKIDLGIDPNLPYDRSDFWAYFNDACTRIEYYKVQTRLKTAFQRKAGLSGVYVLNPALKIEIRHFVEQIKRLIEPLELSQLKKNTLLGKLNAFEAEVDRDRTRLDAGVSAWIWVKKEIKDGADILNPVLDKINKMLDKLTKADELTTALPSPTRGGELEAPPKRLGAPKKPSIADELDDDIPF